MAENKTKPTDQSVTAFLDQIENGNKREDAYSILHMMQEVTGLQPVMWESGIVGFGQYHYQGRSGRSGEWFRIGFSPRKQSLTLYLLPGSGEFHDMLERLGKYTTGVGCLYIKQLSEVDQTVLRQIVVHAFNRMNELYPA